MKKLLIIAMVAVFALSFVASIASAKRPDIPFCAFDSCDYEKTRVRLLCYNPSSGKTFYMWSYDPAYFERWCE